MARGVWSVNEGPQVEAFERWWSDEEGPEQRLSDDATAAMIIGAALIVFAAVTLAMKLAWIAALIVLAVQVAAAIAASFATFGAASASIPGFIAVCRQVCIRVLRHVIDDVIKKSITTLLQKAQKLLRKATTRSTTKKAARHTMTEISDALKKVNPNFHSGVSHQMNCPNCVTAYELRRRGYDAEAAPLSTGRSWSETEQLWGRSWTYGSQNDIYNAFSESGSRGIVGVTWSDPNNPGISFGNHVFNVENVGGRVNFVDGQPNPGLIDASQHISKGSNYRFIRVDDLPTPDMGKLYPEWVHGARRG